MSGAERARAGRARDVFSPFRTRREVWVARVASPPGELSGARRVRCVVREGSRHRAVVLDAAEKRELLTAALIARASRPPIVVMAETTWKVGRNPLDELAARAGLRLLDGAHVRYCVLSSGELESFPRTWRVDPRRVAFTPYHYTLSDAELLLRRPGDGSIFAGGVSLRDYGPLVEAMRSIPNELTIATTGNKRWARTAPANVIVRETTAREYNELTAAASVVVVPLEARGDRSAGQATYLNAMALGKAVVVTDVLGVRDYVRDGETGVIVRAGDAQQISRALSRLLAHPAYAARLGEAARRDVLARFGPERYLERLLEVVDEALASPLAR